MGESVRMHHDEGAELLGPGEERPEFRIGQFLAVDIGQDLDALQFQVVHDVVEFADRDLRLLQGDDAEPDEAVRLARAIFRHAVIGEAMGGFGDFRIDRVVALARRRRHDLDVDAHLVEIEQAAVDRGHDLADVLLLLRVDLLGGGIGEMRQRNPAEIDMRLRQLGGLGHHDMGVNVDRGGRRTPGEAVGVVDAGGGAAIAVLAIDHWMSSAVDGLFGVRRDHGDVRIWRSAAASSGPKPRWRRRRRGRRLRLPRSRRARLP